MTASSSSLREFVRSNDAAVHQDIRASDKGRIRADQKRHGIDDVLRRADAASRRGGNKLCRAGGNLLPPGVGGDDARADAFDAGPLAAVRARRGLDPDQVCILGRRVCHVRDRVEGELVVLQQLVRGRRREVVVQRLRRGRAHVAGHAEDADQARPALRDAQKGLDHGGGADEVHVEDEFGGARRRQPSRGHDRCEVAADGGLLGEDDDRLRIRDVECPSFDAVVLFCSVSLAVVRVFSELSARNRVRPGASRRATARPMPPAPMTATT